MSARALILLLLGAIALPAQLTPAQQTDNLASFEIVWRTVRDHHPDRNLNGLDWQAIHDSTHPLIENAQSMDEVRAVLRAMVAKLGSSHYAIIPSDRYQTPPESKPPEVTVPAASPTAVPTTPAAPIAPESQPAGAMVHFGNLPDSRVYFESRTLPDGAGYIRFNEFLDPSSIMPKLQAALKGFAAAPGIILDLRGNPGGIGVMASGVAGFFIDKPGLELGEMTTRETTIKFVIFPRPETYDGPFAILVDERSASTTEILAGGLQDLGRARIFGERTAGAALPSDIIRLPNGDRFQYAQASYTSAHGKVLEGNGVTPDVVIRETPEAERAGRDLVIEAADAWFQSTRHSKAQ